MPMYAFRSKGQFAEIWMIFFFVDLGDAGDFVMYIIFKVFKGKLSCAEGVVGFIESIVI